MCPPPLLFSLSHLSLPLTWRVPGQDVRVGRHLHGRVPGAPVAVQGGRGETVWREKKGRAGTPAARKIELGVAPARRPRALAPPLPPPFTATMRFSTPLSRDWGAGQKRTQSKKGLTACNRAPARGESRSPSRLPPDGGRRCRRCPARAALTRPRPRRMVSGRPGPGSGQPPGGGRAPLADGAAYREEEESKKKNS